MKRNLLSISRLLTVLVVSLGFWCTATLYAQTTATMPGKDWQVSEYTVDGNLTLYDSGGVSESSKSITSMVRLKPAQPGLPLTIKITTLSKGRYGEPQLHLYSGVKQWDEEDDGWGGTDNSIPRAERVLTPKDIPASFQSSSADGVITLVLKSVYGCDLVAEVTQPVAGPMTYKEVKFHEEAPRVSIGKKQATVLAFDIITEGNENPLELKSLKIKGLDNAFSNLKVIVGKKDAVAFDPTSGEVPATLLNIGTTPIIIKGDVDPSVAKNAEKTLSIESITLGTGEKKLEPAKSCKLTLVPEAVMEAPSSIYIVDQPLTFYDDGGANGNISNNFQGKTIFIPADPSKKVVIEFTNLQLFDTSSVGKNDILNVYSGSDLATASLMQTFLKELGTVYSTAEDGSLLVTLKSITAYTKAGFVATVKAEVPQPMAFKEVAVTPKKLDNPLSAISKNVEVATLGITTQYSAAPLELSSLSFKLEGPISEIAIYNAAGTRELGRATGLDNASVAEIKLATPFALGQNNNTFSIQVSINDKCESGATYKLSLVEVKSVKGTQKSPAESTEITGKIENTVVATIGSQNVTLYSPWQFVHERGKYSDNYTTDAGQRIITFTAPNEGDVVTLNFASFELNFPSYGNTPEFIVYDGADATAPLLWKATKDNKSVGPGETLFSSGRTMTVVINMKGGYSGKGWKATASAVKAPRIGVKQIQQEALGNTFVSLLSTEEAPIAKLELSAASYASPRIYESIEVEVKGNHSLAKQYKLYQVFGSEEKLVSEVASSSSDLLSFAFSTENPLSVVEGPNTFVLKVIANDAAKGDSKLSYRFTKLTIKGEDPFEVAAPSTPIEKNFVNIVEQHTSGDPKTYKLSEGTSILYTDEGGSDGNMTEDKYETVVTFLPAKEGEIVVFDIKEIELLRTCKMFIYDGTKVDDDKLILEIDNKVPQNFCWGTLAQGGALTVKIEKKVSRSLKQSGWKIDVTSKVPSERKVTKVTSTARDKQEALYGQTYIPVFDLAFTIQGENKGTKLPAIKVSAPHAAAVHLSFAGKENLFSKGLQTVEGVKQEGSDVFLIQDENLYELNGEVYGFVSIDAPKESVEGGEVSVTLTQLGDEAITDKKALVAIKKGLNGEYIVGAEEGAAYSTLTDALKALKAGVSGPVTFQLCAGVYEGMFNVEGIPGASANNPIKFISKTGKAQDVTITHKADASEAGYRAPKGLFIIDDTPYVTLEALTLKSTVKVADNVLFVTNGSSHFTLKNCVILSQKEAPSQYSGRFGGVNVVGGAKNFSQCDFVTIEGNRFEGGSIALGISPVRNVSFKNPRGIVVRNNQFENAYSKMIYTSTGACEDLLIEGNKMIFNIDNPTAELWAMDVMLSGANEKILNNSLVAEKHSRIIAFFLRKSTAKQVYKGSTLFANNSAVISNPANEKTIRYPGIKGIFFSDPEIKNLTIAHNTIRLELGESPERAEGEEFKNDPFATCLHAQTSKNLVIKNNLFYNSRKGAIINFSGLEIVKVSHNGYYGPSEKPFIYQYKNPDNRVTNFECNFDDWKARMTDDKSVFLQPTFLDPKSAALKDGQAFNVGEPMEEVATDITDLPRSKEHPTVGAYEYVNDYDKELKLKEPTVVATTENSATISFVAERSSKLYYKAVKATEEAPTKEALLALDPITCIAGTKEEIVLNELEANTQYKLYGVLKALSEDKTSELITIIPFETPELPTQPASFDDVKNYQEGQPFADGTMQFTGFAVAKEGTNGVATRADGTKGEVLLTNTTKGLLIKSMLIRGKGEVVLTTDLAKKRILKLADDKDFVLVGLESLGLIKVLSIEGGSKVAIDNFGYAPEAPTFAELKDIIVKEGENALPEVKTLNAAVPYKVVVTADKKDITLDEVWTPTVPVAALTCKATSEVRLKITDEIGRELSNSFFVVVNPTDGTPAMATFEEPLNDEEGEEAYYRIKKPFFSGSFKFNNSYNAEWGSWSGFSVSRSTKTDFIDYKQSQWNVPSGHGAEGSKSFGVFFKSYRADDAIMLVDPLIAQPLHGMYVSITSYTLSHVEKGDSYTPEGFKDGHFYEVKVTADNGKSVTIPVADYRNGKKNVLKEWTWVSFKELGNVKSLTFTVDGNVKNEYGLVTPTYLAIDNIGDTTNPEGNEGVIRGEMPELFLAGNKLTVKNAQGVLVSLYDLSGRLLYQIRPTSNDYSEELSLAEGTYIAVCAGARTKLVF